MAGIPEWPGPGVQARVEIEADDGRAPGQREVGDHGRLAAFNPAQLGYGNARRSRDSGQGKASIASCHAELPSNPPQRCEANLAAPIEQSLHCRHERSVVQRAYRSITDCSVQMGCSAFRSLVQ